MAPTPIGAFARRIAVLTAALALLGLGASAGLADTGFEAPVITAFSARVSSCDESDFGCMEVSWTARDPGSSQLLYDLVVEHAGGRVSYTGGGSFLPGRRVRASLVPRTRPLCGGYLLTLTVRNDAQILTSRVRSLTRRTDCVTTDARHK